MSDFQRKSSMENYRTVSANRYKDTLKASLKDFDIHVPVGSWEQTAQERSKWRVSSTKEQLSMKKKRESVKLKESAENAKPISMGHQLIP